MDEQPLISGKYAEPIILDGGEESNGGDGEFDSVGSCRVSAVASPSPD